MSQQKRRKVEERYCDYQAEFINSCEQNHTAEEHNYNIMLDNECNNSNQEEVDYLKPETLYDNEEEDLNCNDTTIQPNINTIKDNILTDTLKTIVLKNNIEKKLTNEILGALNQYGLKLPKTKTELLSYNNGLSTNNAVVGLCLKKMAEMSVTLDEIKATQDRMLNLMEMKKDNEAWKYDFPMTKCEHIIELNQKCEEYSFAEDLIKRIRGFKQSASKSYNCYGLAKLMTDEVMQLFNWEGVNGKKSFSSQKKINEVFFEAWHDESMSTFEQYAENIRAQFTASRCRIHKRRMRQKPEYQNSFN